MAPPTSDRNTPASTVGGLGGLGGRGGRGARGSGLVARWAGGVAALVLAGAGLAGIGLATYTSRVHRTTRSHVVTVLRSSADARLDAQLAAIERDAAGGVDALTKLQTTLPERAAADPDIVLLAITDADGLVLAASAPADNGNPLHDPALRAQLVRPSPNAVAVDLAGRSALLVSRKTPDERIAWVAISNAPIVDVTAALAEEARAATVHGWWVVGLGGFVSMVIAMGVVLLAGGQLARGLRIVAWRISELGRGDRSTHVRLGGPTELQHVGQELERAAERLAVNAERLAAEQLIAHDRVALDALRARILPEKFDAEGLRVTRTGTAPLHASGFAVRTAGARTIVTLLEVVGDDLDDALTVVQMRAAALAVESADAGAVVTSLHGSAASQRVRAIVLSIGASDVQIANAGGAFPLHRRGEAALPIVVRGDRLGEPNAKRSAPATVPFAASEALLLTLDGDACQLTVVRA